MDSILLQVPNPNWNVDPSFIRTPIESELIEVIVPCPLTDLDGVKQLKLPAISKVSPPKELSG